MGVIVAFDFAVWQAQFSEFAAMTQPQAQSYWNMATTIHRNDGGGPVSNAAIQTNLLNFLTAHIAKMFWVNPSGGAVTTNLVGRISSAAEGSVNVQTELPATMPTSSAWFTMTQYGFLYWTASAPYRTARYIPNNQNPVNAGTFGSGNWGYGGDGSGWVG